MRAINARAEVENDFQGKKKFSVNFIVSLSAAMTIEEFSYGKQTLVLGIENFAESEIPFIMPNHPYNSLLWKNAIDKMYESEKKFKQAVKKGSTPEDAFRFLLPSVQVLMNVNATVKQWKQFLRLATLEPVNECLRTTARELLDFLKKHDPEVWDDVKY